MEFDLKARLKFSDNLPQEADFELQKTIEAANNVLFIKGVPSNSVNEAGRIIEWHTNANELYIRIVSGRYTRSHEALLRFRKALENKIPDRIVSLVEEKIKQEQHGTKLENWELIWKSPEKTVFFQLDPTE